MPRAKIFSAWKRLSRGLLLGLFLLGQAGLAFHHHETPAGNGAVSWHKAPAVADAGACRTCELVSQSRFTNLTTSVVAVETSFVAADFIAPRFVLGVSSPVRLSDRAPPSC
jgi:hypothetical protein